MVERVGDGVLEGVLEGVLVVSMSMSLGEGGLNALLLMRVWCRLGDGMLVGALVVSM